MRDTIKDLEILAPAGDMESFYAAVNNGANAIYLGLKDFNARNNVSNFSFEELEQIVDYAHLFSVKIYLTFNILIKNNEMEEALRVIEKAYKIGVDAFILQDLGLVSNIKKFFPGAVLHASTQMGIHNLEGTRFIERLGFSRVVLSRETSLDEIRRIKNNTNLEIEYFVQGALCVAFSGNCYLCSLLTGNSGNRGKCQQFCRLPYKLDNGANHQEGYMLSAKDFCMLPVLKDMFDAGVISFKIEGRARRAAYVAQCVKTYRKVIDNEFIFNKQDIEDLKKVFNRGDFTEGYFQNSKIMHPQIQGHKGVKIGKVEKVNYGKKFNEVIISSQHDIVVGDGLKFIKNNQEIGSLGVGDVSKRNDLFVVTTTANIQANSEVYLTLDFINENKLLKNVKKLKINAIFNAKINKKAELIFIYENNTIKIESENTFIEAEKQPLNYENLFEQLSKLNDEPFELNNLEINIEKIFARKSEINEMRRKAVGLLKKEILKKYKKNIEINPIKLKNINNFSVNNENKEIIVFKDIDNLFKTINYENKILVYKPDNYVLNNIKDFEIWCGKNNLKGYLDLPIFATEQDVYFIKNILKYCPDIGVVANNLYAFDLTSADNIIAGLGLNIYNQYTLELMSSLGVKNIILSKELKDLELNNFKSKSSIYAFSKGNEEYMTLKHCPFKEYFGSVCNYCKYCKNVVYTMNSGKKLILERKKMVSCQFVLKSLDIKEQFVSVNKYIEVL